MKCFIYDYETMGKEPETAPIVSLAYLSFDTDKMIEDNGYDYHDLVRKSSFAKFDVADQVRRLGRKIEKGTVEWWSKQSKEAQEAIKPRTDDLKLEALYDMFFHEAQKQYDWVFTRGNTFDPMFTRHCLFALGKNDPFPFWTIRDTRSYIDGLLVGNEELGNSFVVPGLENSFVAHDPRHDVAMDVMRIQTLRREILL